MDIKSIINKDAVNITNCDSEPIHIPGSIQPHGYLLAVLANTGTITYMSGNTATLFAKSVTEMLDTPLEQHVSAADYSAYLAHIRQTSFDYSKPFVFTISGTQYNTVIQQAGEHLLLELEAFPDGSLDIPNLYTQTRNFVSLIENSSDMKSLCQLIAAETRRITGYDRVMVYRFDAHYNGEVFAESKREDLLSFLGHHYPHTDIPKQARELYLRNLVRIIPDVGYEPVPIYTKDNQATNANLDLSLSILRSVSPIHCQYLQNMGVSATLTISLIQDKKLWGLIACHHYTPKNLPHFTRISALLQGHFLTSQIKVRETEHAYELTKNAEHCVQGLKAAMAAGNNKPEQIVTLAAVKQVAHADGVLIKYKGKLYADGGVPAAGELEYLLQWLGSEHAKETYETAHLAGDYGRGSAIANDASGILYFPMKGDDCIVWFRKELEKHIYWAGNPAEAVSKDSSTDRLSPRTSFELWKEEVKNRSAIWEQPELYGARDAMNAIQKQLLIDELTAEEQKYRVLSEDLLTANQELSRFNWISTHDLKEPLRKMRIFSSIVLSDKTGCVSERAMDMVKRIDRSAGQMQDYIRDILAYSIETRELHFETADLNALLQEVLKDYEDEQNTGKLHIQKARLPVVEAIQSQMKQVFQNLVSNAIKFAGSEETHITIGYEKVLAQKEEAIAQMQGAYHKITVADKGIGFEAQYADRIFEVFQRLHNKDEFEGTGIGLAICRKIIQNHKGHIAAYGKPGLGALLVIYLPVEG